MGAVGRGVLLSEAVALTLPGRASCVEEAVWGCAGCCASVVAGPGTNECAPTYLAPCARGSGFARDQALPQGWADVVLVTPPLALQSSAQPRHET